MTGMIGRRGLVGSIGALAGAATISGCTRQDQAGPEPPAREPELDQDPGATTREFFGARQPGIDDAPQAFLTLLALDLRSGADRESVRRVMAILSSDIPRMMSGHGTLTDQEPELAARAASLTVTVGWGERTFATAEVAPPAWLSSFPSFSIDALQEQWSGGDILLQVCADSPVTVAHAARKLVTAVAPIATPRWVQHGFREPLLDPRTQRMRNLFGQVDETVNLTAEIPEEDPLIWDDGSTWQRDATALVVRRIAMDLDRWDRADRHSREHAIGRRLTDGAPLTGGDETSPPDLEATDALGLPVIDTFSHVRRAMPTATRERFLRRSYNYDTTPEPDAASSSGLVFLAYCADPMTQFVPVQQRLADADLLNIYTTPIGSAVFAILPGCAEGSTLGAELLTTSPG